MFCPDHPKYKGIMEPQGKKKDCETCWSIYKVIAEKTKTYRSITTPEFPCGLSHIITECGTIMLFGPQPPYFWRKDSEAPEYVKKYFSQTFVMLQKAYKKNKDDFAQLRKWFFIIYQTKKREMVFEDLQYQDMPETKIKTEPKLANEQIDTLLEKVKERNNRWETWKRINNGKKEG